VRGYAATPMTAIAERAGVALDTVYAAAGRLAPVLSIIQQAGPAEPELAALWQEIAERRAANMHRFVADLAAVAPLRLDPGDAADIVWATNAPELYQLLVGQQGWSPQRYEDFLADAWRRLLLAG
jgi:AcrR family transcriptional regulator